LEPKLTASCGHIVDFDFKVVQRDPVRRVPYRLKFQLTNVDKSPVEWAVDTSGLAPDASAADTDPPIFSWSPVSATLAPGESQDIEVSFLPQEAREYRAEVPLFLDGASASSSKPYLTFTLLANGLFPQLTFDTREVVLPVVPLGFTARASFNLINTGYDYLELRHRIPSETGPQQVGCGLHWCASWCCQRSCSPVWFFLLCARCMRFA
jgi:hypothetical protein